MGSLTALDTIWILIAAFLLFFTIFLVFFLILKKTMGIRVKNETEIKGLDIEEHGMEAYAGFQIFIND
jgi:ammonium transporter, Amt family